MSAPRRKVATWDKPLPRGMRGAKLQKGLLVQTGLFRREGVIEPPYSPRLLIQMLSMSQSLRPAIDAYAVNIDQFGHTLKSTLDLSRDDIKAVVGSSMLEERRMEAELLSLETGKPPIEPEEPTPAEIKARIAEVAKDMERERQRIEFWLKSCCPEMTFIALRKISRVDLELTGNAYWEVIRNDLGEPAEINHIPVASIAATVRDTVPTKVEVRLHRTPITIASVMQRIHFRKYIQQGAPGTEPRYFKQHGDPRVMSSKTGTYYKDARALDRAEKDVAPATEVRHFKIDTPASEVYGAPRWEGCMIGLQGARDAEEVNFHYFRNKSVPPMALLVSGSTVSKDTVDELKDTIENDLHGTKNFHRVLVIQAESTAGPMSSGTTKLELKPLVQITEGQFMHYIEKNAASLVGSFRLPQLYRGEISSFNRATAQVAVEVTEQQVFHPEREAFDSVINRFFFYDLGIRYWLFKSLGPPTANADERATIVCEGAKQGIPTLNEARELWGVLVGRELEPIAEPWGNLPLLVALEVARLAELPQETPPSKVSTSPDGTTQPDNKQEPGKPPRAEGRRQASTAPRATRKADSDAG